MRHPLKHRLEGAVDIEVWGLRLRLMPRGNLSESRWLFMPQFVDRTEREYIRKNLPAGGVFVDIGANAGLYSFWAASVCLNGAGRVLAIEPDPELQRRMTFNRDENDLSNIELIPVAVGDRDGEGRLLAGDKNRGENRIANSANDAGTPASPSTIAIKPLASLLDERGVARVDGLKIDIEGEEHRVMRHFFANAAEALWPRFLVFETCTQAQASSMQALATEMGYRTVAKGRLNTIAAL